MLNGPDSTLGISHDDGLEELQYPVEPAAIPQIEQQLHLRISVYGFNDEDGLEPCPIYVTHRLAPEPVVNLLYFEEHYACIKDFSRFARSAVTKHEHRHYFCKRCLGHFQTEHTLAEHMRICTREDFNAVIWRMPPPGAEIKFRNFKRQGHAPFVIYADFEAYLQSLIDEDEHLEAAGARPATIRSTLHKPIAIGALIVAGKPIFEPPPGYQGLLSSAYFSAVGENAATEFLEKLQEWEAFCLAEMEKDHPFLGRPPRWYDAAQECYLCHKPFDDTDTDRNLRKVLDHDHFTGKIIGAAHSICNLERRKCFQIPVFFHNFRGYDSHFIAKAFSRYPQIPIRPIAQTMEKYLQVEWGKRIVFRDSLQFLNASLDSLIKSLTASKGDFTFFDRHMRLLYDRPR